jgi:methyl-accepting chemotaxis protein
MSQEYVLNTDIVIMSRSDLQGNIVSYNAGFRDASGYTDAELMGKPHNILRHPDMPAAAFADLWQTIADGRTWTGVIKNKRKNGDYYWVFSNTSPIIEHGSITGYVSVRYPATQAQIQATESLYQTVKNKTLTMPITKVAHPIKAMTLATLSLVTIALPAVIRTFGEHLPIAIEIGLSAFSVLVISYLIYTLFQLEKPNHALAQHALDMANGEFKDPIQDIQGNTPWSNLLNILRTRYAETAATQYDNQRESIILQTALDNASTNLMVADEHFNIIRVNHALQQMFKGHETTLKSALSHFDLNNLVGSNMDIFHHNPAHQRQVLQQLTQPWQGDIKLGGLILRLKVVPILQNGFKLGYLVEWLDRTQESIAEHNITQAMDRLALGFLDSRISTDNMSEGFLKLLAEKINTSMHVFAKTMQEMGDYMLRQGEANMDTLPPIHKAGDAGFMQSALNLAMSNQASIVTEVRTQMALTQHAIESITQSVYDAADRSQQQAAALEESATTSEEISAQAQAMKQQASEALIITQQMQEEVLQTKKIMLNTLMAMETIQQKSQQIEAIVSLIDSISFQTNLLALNAAVEAARAGEHGRGFAVVASEVRDLAQKSADAAKDIKTLIDSTVSDIQHGNEQVHATEIAIARVEEASLIIQNQISTMESAVTQTVTGVNELNIAISNLDTATQHTASLMEEIAANTQEVNHQANDVLQALSVYKTGSMNGLLDLAQANNDFRYAKTRRFIRTWAIRSEANILYGDGQPYRLTVEQIKAFAITITPEIEQVLSNVAKAIQSYSERKLRGERFDSDDFQTLHHCVKTLINAVTNEEKNDLSQHQLN